LECELVNLRNSLFCNLISPALTYHQYQGSTSMKRIPAFLILIIACSPIPALDNFNMEKWKNDEQGCKSLRKVEISSLMEQRTKLMGLSEEEIIKLLGNPDETNLYQRTQKFLVYYTSPGPKCDMPEAGASRFEIRISALHVVNEVVHYP